MAARVLVMCQRCGRSQFVTQATCLDCGAKLPAGAAKARAKSKPPGDPLLAPYDPFLEAYPGGEKQLSLSERRLEWQLSPARSFVADLTRVSAVRLSKRPIWETFLPVSLLAGVAFLPSQDWLRISLWAFAGLWLLTGLLQTRCALVVRMKDGEAASILLGTGSRAVKFADALWDSMSPELERLGIPARG